MNDSSTDVHCVDGQSRVSLRQRALMNDLDGREQEW